MNLKNISCTYSSHILAMHDKNHLIYQKTAIVIFRMYIHSFSYLLEKQIVSSSMDILVRKSIITSEIHFMLSIIMIWLVLRKTN